LKYLGFWGIFLQLFRNILESRIWGDFFNFIFGNILDIWGFWDQKLFFFYSFSDLFRIVIFFWGGGGDFFGLSAIDSILKPL
jgi:hypothetical protein